ncbi:MAG: Gfo/Idh/MocA family oxidoreductase [Actinobacteria bacterium]|nr:Gfo/Idh/MocA family oxidoreductase [Actinomycetota bacterium]
MQKKIRFGIVGLVHDHVWPVWNEGYIRELLNLKDVEIIAVADTNQELLIRANKDFNINKNYLNYKEMLNKEELDAVLMALPNDEKADAIELLAAKGIHVLMDKPMAATLDQANRIYKAAEKAGIKLLVNWPSAWDPAIQKALSLIQQGEIGNIFAIKAGMSNPGPENHGCTKYFLEWLFSAEKNGGGALVDYCCYGILYALTILGLPKKVIGSDGRYIKKNITAEDNALVVMEYPNAYAISMGSWSEYGADNTPQEFEFDNKKIYFGGETGAIVVKSFENKFHIISANYPKGKIFTGESLKENDNNGPAYFVKCIKEDLPIEGMVNPKLCRDVQEVMEAAYISIKTGKKVELPI